ncbi:Trm112 family protein [Arthrobacter sp. VKM Ac-2550]|uniref:Trm112 family protein n=1 Tax=Crystallibacter permensis TaxID=1938888 RepID=UPI0022264832|nr:hypothetical protein [Arthrobacter sp. VKM Ac-2550]MCW2132456.1 hypothetical protein [Arthrobacter sp. VKM Ac-2550]
MAHLSPELLAVLRCPVTGSSLVQEGEELVSSAKDASGQQLRYRIDEGIPVLLPPALHEAAQAAEARPTDAQAASAQPATDNSPNTPATDA